MSGDVLAAVFHARGQLIRDRVRVRTQLDILPTPQRGRRHRQLGEALDQFFFIHGSAHGHDGEIIRDKLVDRSGIVRFCSQPVLLLACDNVRIDGAVSSILRKRSRCNKESRTQSELILA